jgi:hypothetical protein
VDDQLELERVERDEHDQPRRDDDAVEDGRHHSLVTARRMRSHARDERALSRRARIARAHRPWPVAHRLVPEP